MLKLFRCFRSERVRSKNKRDPLYNFISYLELNLTKNDFEAYFKELSREFKPYFNITQYSKFLYKMLSNIRQINSGRFLIYKQKITCLSQISRSNCFWKPTSPTTQYGQQAAGHLQRDATEGFEPLLVLRSIFEFYRTEIVGEF